MPRKAPSKRGLTLDLNAPVATKKTRLQQAAAAAPVLTTPDVQMLKLSSPELAKFLTSSNALPSGSTLPTPTAGSGTYLFPKNVTEEQELYAKGFEEALNSLKSKEAGAGGEEERGVGARRGAKSAGKAAPTPPKGSSAVAIEAIERATSAHNTRAVAAAAAVAAATAVAGTTGGQIPVAVSDIPSAVAPTSSVPAARVPSSPRPPSAASGSVDSSECDSLEIKEERTDDEGAAEEPSSSSSTSSNNKRNKRSSGSAASSSGGLGVSPIDMEDQEKIKLERKRMRNRLAATKCRKRKLERISHLDDRVAVLKGENAELAAVVKRLKASVCELKQEVMEHVNSGCQIMIADESAAFS